MSKRQVRVLNVINFPASWNVICSAGRRNHVKRIDPYQFYELGIALRALRNLEGAMTVGAAAGVIFGAKNWLDRLLGDSPLIDLRHCRHSAEQLLSTINGIANTYMFDKNGTLELDKWGDTIPEYGFYGISNAIETFEHNFAAEMRDAAVYSASQVGMYNTGDLVDRTELHIPAELRRFINDNAILEVKSAGRCLAFGLPTACGFHILRATESVLEV